ncbi:MAG TPA: KTSC domain-containing protein [Blastocatellia bacterium]|nr:KTSC domain-containing protein [Blastocatellia bacterium]
MSRVPLSSSTVASVGFQPETQVLEIEFTNGRIYQYQPVPEWQYEALMAADSKGIYFNKSIRSAGYSYSRLVEREDQRS